MAGTLTDSNGSINGKVKSVTLSYTTDASGDVNSNTSTININGVLVGAHIDHGTLTTGYTLKVYDGNNTGTFVRDLLLGQGAALTVTASKELSANDLSVPIDGQTLTPVVTGGGNAKSGSIKLYYV